MADAAPGSVLGTPPFLASGSGAVLDASGPPGLAVNSSEDGAASNQVRQLSVLLQAATMCQTLARLIAMHTVSLPDSLVPSLHLTLPQSPAVPAAPRPHSPRCHQQLAPVRSKQGPLHPEPAPSAKTAKILIEALGLSKTRLQSRS